MKILSFLLLALASVPAFGQAAIPTATAQIIGTKNEQYGSVRVTETPQGLLVHLEARSLPAGWHAIHFHAVSNCTAADFSSAGDHATHGMQGHGYLDTTGPHLGDLPNLYVHSDGLAFAEYYLTGIRLSELMDADGAALIIHDKTDDYKTQPSGMSGNRIACAALKRL